MASSSAAATCNVGDVSSTIFIDEKALWNRMLLVEKNIEADRAAGTQSIELQIERHLPSAADSLTHSAQPSENQGQESMLNQLLQIERQREACRASLERLEAQRAEAATLELLLATASRDRSARVKSTDFKTSNALLNTMEGQQVDFRLSSPQICFLLNNLLGSDIQRNWESRFLKLFWRYSTGISDADLLLFLSKLAEHYLPSHEVEILEEFMLTNEERAKFLYDCSILDRASRLAMDFNEFSLHLIQDQKPKYWTRRDHTLHLVSSSELVKPLEVIFPFSTRFEAAKECLDRLDLLKSVTVDLNPHESETLASVLETLKLPEIQALHALKKEMELYKQVALQLEQLSGKHQHAFETWGKDQLEGQDELFHTCQEEKKNVVLEALYKKVKCLASIKKANANRQVKLSSKDLMKWMLLKARSALKELEGKLKKSPSSGEVCSKECTLCYSEFSKKRKRAWLDPCGHASACIDCATKAWENKPYCPWCKASIIQKPISIPAQIFL